MSEAVTSDREKTQMYFQRYMAHFPAAGEIMLFDRSWYNRAGVERVMGFCADHEYERFLHVCPGYEREIVESGVTLLKYFFDVSQEEQDLLNHIDYKELPFTPPEAGKRKKRRPGTPTSPTFKHEVPQSY